MGAMELPDAVDAIRPSVVQIRLLNDLNNVLGTGFSVDERATVITAWHVLKAGADLAQQRGVMVTRSPRFARRSAPA
jgi:hypothetical protein